MSMDTLKAGAEGTIKAGQDKLKSAQEMRNEIDILKSGFEGINKEGMDDSVVSVMEAAEQAGRDQATTEINEMQDQANEDLAQAESIKSEIDVKISENNAAKTTLDSLKSNKYGGGIDSATSAIEKNTAVGEDVKATVDKEFQSIMSEIRSAASGI